MWYLEEEGEEADKEDSLANNNNDTILNHAARKISADDMYCFLATIICCYEARRHERERERERERVKGWIIEIVGILKLLVVQKKHHHKTLQLFLRGNKAAM